MKGSHSWNLRTFGFISFSADEGPTQGGARWCIPASPHRCITAQLRKGKAVHNRLDYSVLYEVLRLSVRCPLSSVLHFMFPLFITRLEASASEPAPVERGGTRIAQRELEDGGQSISVADSRVARWTPDGSSGRWALGAGRRGGTMTRS